MRTSRAEAGAPSAVRARIVDDAVVIDLSDGRTVTAPLAWFPRLLHGTGRERNHWRFTGRGEFIRWPDLDEDTVDIPLNRPASKKQFPISSCRRCASGLCPEPVPQRLNFA